MAGIKRYKVTVDGETAHIGTAAELAVVLDVLHGRCDRVVLLQLRPCLPKIIANPEGLLVIFKSLSAADRLFLIAALGEELPRLVGRAAHLREILATTAEQEVEEKLLRAVGPTELRRMLATAHDLAAVLQWVYGQCDRLVLRLLGKRHLRKLFHDGEELGLALNCLDRDGQAELIAALGWRHVAALVDGGRDLAVLMRALPAGLGKQLLSRYSPKRLRELIGNQRDWQFLYRHLEEAEARHLCKMLGVRRHAP